MCVRFLLYSANDAMINITEMAKYIALCPKYTRSLISHILCTEPELQKLYF